MPQEQILPHQFMFQPREIRELIAAMFGVGKSGVTEVRDQTVVSDGRTLDDLKAISLEKMQEYIGIPDASWGVAWEETVKKAAVELAAATAPSTPADVREGDSAAQAEAEAKAAAEAQAEAEAKAAAEAQAEAEAKAAAEAEVSAKAQAEAEAGAETEEGEEELPPLPGSNE